MLLVATSLAATQRDTQIVATPLRHEKLTALLPDPPTPPWHPCGSLHPWKTWIVDVEVWIVRSKAKRIHLNHPICLCFFTERYLLPHLSIARRAPYLSRLQRPRYFSLARVRTPRALSLTAPLLPPLRPALHHHLRPAPNTSTSAQSLHLHHRPATPTSCAAVPSTSTPRRRLARVLRAGA